MELSPIVLEAIAKGDAPIKSQYLKKRTLEEVSKESEENKKEESECNKEEGESKSCSTSNKKAKPTKISKKEKKEEKKKRNEQRLQSLCKAIAQGKECTYGEKCKYNHDVDSFLANKPPDISERCHVFDQTGRCPFGLICRFGGAHIKDKIPINALEQKDELNLLNKDLQNQLRRKVKLFPQSTPVIQKWRQEKKKRAESNGKKDMEEEEEITKHEGTLVDKEVPMRPIEIKPVDFKDKLYLAPLTTIGNLPFRRICKNLGADITCGEMALSVNLLQGQASEWALLKRHSSEDVFGVQVCGSQADVMIRCAEILNETMTVDFVDINVGCPIDLIYQKGAGSALLEHTRRLFDICNGMSSILSVPLTIKVRIGKDEKAPTVHKIFPELKSWGVSAVTVHGRSRNQRYTKEADWNYISKCAQLTDLPVIGNGDLFSFEEYNLRKKDPKIASVMLARGAIIKPWLFKEIKEQRHFDISASERLDLIKDFIHYGLEHWGSDTQGVENTRRFFLEWQSFLHRYIPIGILETYPIKINQRPSPFIGRDELETLLASPDVNDWVKISSMFLGPPPKDFHFTPKHKSNAYSSNNREVEG